MNTKDAELVLTNGHDAIIGWDEAGSIISWNEGAKRLYGFDPEEIIGRPVDQIVPESERQELHAMMHRLQGGQSLQSTSMKRLTKSGEVVSVLTRLSLHRDHEISGFTSVEKMIGSADRPKEVSDEKTFVNLMKMVSTYAIFILDSQGRIASWNLGAERIKGYSAEEVVGKDISIFYTDEEKSRGEPAQLLDEAARQGSSEAEGWRMRKDGSLFWARVITTALKDRDGTLRGYSKIVCDLTEKKRSESALQKKEKQFRSLVENSLDLITLVDEHGTVSFQSDSVRRIMNYEPGEILGKSLFDFVHPGDLPAVLDGFSRLLKGEPCGSLEVRVRHKSGNWRTLEARGSNLLANPNIGGVLINAVDVSDRKHLEKEILRFNEHEQVRLGYDLHDGLTQHLVGLEFMVRVLEQKLRAKSLEEAKDVSKIADYLNQAIIQTRDLARELYPMGLGEESFPEALYALASDIQRHFQTRCDVISRAPVRIANEELALHAYQLVREAVKDAVKTGHASHITIELKPAREQITISVTDDGKAADYDVRRSRENLRNINNRAKMMNADLSTRKTPGGGMTLFCTFPNK